jgi:hypothetical protein
MRQEIESLFLRLCQTTTANFVTRIRYPNLVQIDVKASTWAQKISPLFKEIIEKEVASAVVHASQLKSLLRCLICPRESVFLRIGNHAALVKIINLEWGQVRPKNHCSSHAETYPAFCAVLLVLCLGCCAGIFLLSGFDNADLI